MKHYNFCGLRSLAVAATIVAGTMTATISAAEQVIPFLACPLGCGAVQTNTVLAARMARDGSDVLPAAQETPGFMYNIRAMAEEARWKNTVFGTEDIVIQAAFQGGREELKKFVPQSVPIKFQLLYGEGAVAQGKFFVTFDPDINSIGDLKGKRVSIGLPTQSDWGMSAALFLEFGYGINEENTDIRFVTPAVMTQELIDGTTDAALVALVTNGDQTVWWTNDLASKLHASGQTIKYLGVSDEAIDTVNEKFGMTYGRVTVPAGSMPGQTEEFIAGTDRIFAAVHPDFPEDVAYKIVMGVHKHGPALRETGQGFWKFWSEANMISGLTEETAHPGAIKAYKELGLWERTKDFPPMKYPEN